jgi:hypothetical protein
MIQISGRTNLEMRNLRELAYIKFEQLTHHLYDFMAEKEN